MSKFFLDRVKSRLKLSKTGSTEQEQFRASFHKGFDSIAKFFVEHPDYHHLDEVSRS